MRLINNLRSENMNWDLILIIGLVFLGIFVWFMFLIPVIFYGVFSLMEKFSDVKDEVEKNA